MAKENENNEQEKEIDQTSQEHFGEQMGEIFSKKDESFVESNGQPMADQDNNVDEIDNNQESAEADETETQNENTDEVTLDPEVAEIFSDYGLSQETIDSIVKESPELLSSIKEEIENEKQQSKPVVEKQNAPKSTFKEIKVNLDPDLVGADVKSAIDSIVSRINEQGKSLESETQRLQQERESSFQQKIDGHFDRFSKQIPQLGNSSNMSEGQYKTRLELFRHAMVTSEIRGIPIEKAIETEINKFKNQDGEKVAAQRLVDKLNGQKKHFTNPPTRRHSDISTRKFETENERKEAIMDEAYKKAGIE
jgi:hypothetical protein